jgi:hypothetical protein
MLQSGVRAYKSSPSEFDGENLWKNCLVSSMVRMTELSMFRVVLELSVELYNLKLEWY